MTVNMEEALYDGYYKFMVLDVIRHGKLCEMLSQRVKGEVMTAMCRLWKKVIMQCIARLLSSYENNLERKHDFLEDF